MEQKTEESVRFFTRIAPRYDLGIIQWWMKKFQEGVIQEIDGTKPLTLLDTACGTGELLLTLQDKVHPKSRLCGIDITERMLEIAEKKLPKTTTVEKQDVHDLKFKNNSFDYVISTEAFHHYANQKKALGEMCRVARKEVIVVDVEFFFKAVHRMFAFVEPGCVKINTPKEMKMLFEEAGLKEIKQRRNFLFSMVTSGKKTKTSRLCPRSVLKVRLFGHFHDFSDKIAFYTQCVHFHDNTADVMTDDFAEHFIDLCSP